MEALQNPDAVLQPVASPPTKAEKKAAKRAALIQDIAEAVYTLGLQRQNETEAKRQQAELATKLARKAREATEQAAYNAAHPVEAAYLKSRGMAGWGNSFICKPADKEGLALYWAKEEGILPKATAEMPDAEAQFLALAQWTTRQGS